ncbi:hemerythrin domain-containing protein [Arthrobacter agilis]|uniref:hemerythrin domain-containing protein n=1 Tax=Arthrobacter agilis TaxID=37921 RepID=UPI000B35B18F|nr:hemerythrin domain-containing protein [Arthrobacter agilis]PPB45234.1 hemerythrin domain-containing protein [Arthrobacter agilis]TPV27937.1 hemerythrin domain-containing protein [Arthrobacter agilis]VDR31380.1 Alr3199 protein [Arthrobacter agilis]
MYTSVADQTTDQLGGPLSVLVRQKRDHVRLNGLIGQLRGTTGEDQAAVLLAVYRLVFPHAFAEESVLWPVMRRVLPDGGELTLAVEREHQEVNELVQKLEGLDDGTPERADVLGRLSEVLDDDVRDEEDALFPRLQERVSRRELQVLGVLWEAVRLVAPTRAHPVVARRPPGNVVAALPLSVLDRGRDVLDRVLLSAPERLVPALHRVSSALAGASHAVELLPIMRSGEHSSTRLVAGRPPVSWGAALVAAAAGSLVRAEVVGIARRRRRDSG